MVLVLALSLQDLRIMNIGYSWSLLRITHIEEVHPSTVYFDYDLVLRGYRFCHILLYRNLGWVSILVNDEGTHVEMRLVAVAKLKTQCGER